MFSSTNVGSAYSVPRGNAGPVKPMVAYESSTMLGKSTNNAGFTPDAFHVVFWGLFQAPSGTLMVKGLSALLMIALKRSVLLRVFTYTR